MRHVVEAALASRARPVVVVIGHAREAVEAALAGLPVTFALQSGFRQRALASLRAGVAARRRDAAGALVLLGDMPRIGAPR